MSARHATARRARAAAPRAAPAAAPRTRIAAVDALRGAPLLLMFVYHFFFDLRFYRMGTWDFEHDPFWLGYRALVVAWFMLVVGVSLVLADRGHATTRHFWNRVGVIAACAIAVSVGSYLVFPRTFIYFGILHSIALASIFAWPLVCRPRLAFALGVAAIAAGLALRWRVFDVPWLSWIGLTTAKPATEDYVPLLPWGGFVFVGVAIGNALARVGFQPLRALDGAPRWLTWLGRHSLLVYMIHQPILLGLLWLVVR